MYKQFLLVVALVLTLTACSSRQLGQQQAMNNNMPSVTTGDGLSNTPGVDSNANVGGNVSQGMDKSDLLKMSRALDKPLGKETTWSNLSSGMNYSVTPTEKVSVNGNHLCRKYNTTASRGAARQQYTGTACITADGNWHPVG